MRRIPGAGGGERGIRSRSAAAGDGKEPAVKSYYRQKQNAATMGESEGTLHPSPSRTQDYMPPRRELDGSLRFRHTRPK